MKYKIHPILIFGGYIIVAFAFFLNIMHMISTNLTYIMISVGIIFEIIAKVIDIIDLKNNNENISKQICYIIIFLILLIVMFLPINLNIDSLLKKY